MKPPSKPKKLKIGILIYTYDRVLDAMVNMDIIKSIWKDSSIFSEIKIVHAFNGEKRWYPIKYKEDVLIKLKNPGHFQGASELLDAGVEVFQKKFAYLDYIIVLAADTWLIDLKYLNKTFKSLVEEKYRLATCPWGLPERNSIFDVGMAVDFFIFDHQWASKYGLFPIEYKEFKNRFGELILYQSGGNVSLEKLLFARYINATFREFNDNNNLKQNALKKLLSLNDRMPVHSHIDKSGHWIRKPYWPKMGLLTHHEIAPKQKILNNYNKIIGKSVDRFKAIKNI